MDNYIWSFSPTCEKECECPMHILRPCLLSCKSIVQRSQLSQEFTIHQDKSVASLNEECNLLIPLIILNQSYCIIVFEVSSSIHSYLCAHISLFTMSAGNGRYLGQAQLLNFYFIFVSLCVFECHCSRFCE